MSGHFHPSPDGSGRDPGLEGDATALGHHLNRAHDVAWSTVVACTPSALVALHRDDHDRPAARVLTGGQIDDWLAQRDDPLENLGLPGALNAVDEEVLEELAGIPVHVEASLDVDVIEFRRPDGTVVGRQRLSTGEADALRRGALRGLSIAPSDPPTALELADRLRDREPLSGVVVCDAHYPPDRAFIEARPSIRCMRPLGHLPPHAHIDLSSLDRMPLRTWRSAGEL